MAVDGTSELSVTGNATGTTGGLEVVRYNGDVSVEIGGDVKGEKALGILIGEDTYPRPYYTPYETVSDPDNVNGYEVQVGSDQNGQYYVDPDGNTHYVRIIPDPTTHAPVAVDRETGDRVRIGVYAAPDGSNRYFILTGDQPSSGSDVSISVGGDVTSNGYGMIIDGDSSADMVVDALVEGTISGGKTSVIVTGSIKSENVNLTVWKIELNDEGCAVTRSDSRIMEQEPTNPDEMPSFDAEQDADMEARVMYIIKLEQPNEGGTLSATDDTDAALEQSHDFVVAHEGDTVRLKVDLKPGYKVVAAYNGEGKEQALKMDSEGRYFVEVPKGGGVYLSVELGKESYKVTFADEDGTELQSSMVEYGATPKYDGAEPTKASTDEWTYTFSGWSQALDPVTGDITFVATYQQAARSYDLTFDLAGGTLDGQTGTATISAAWGETVTLPLPTREGYRFSYWQGSRYEAGDAYLVQGSHTFTAIWEPDGSQPGQSTDPNRHSSQQPGATQARGELPKTGDATMSPIALCGLGVAGLIAAAAGVIIARRHAA